MVEENIDAWEEGRKTIVKRAKQTASYNHIFSSPAVEDFIQDIYTIGFEDGRKSALKPEEQ